MTTQAGSLGGVASIAAARGCSAARARPVPGETHREFFERLYREASSDATMVPWATMRASPSLVAWLNAEACAHVRPGSRAAVVGCGLGDDAAELAERGFDVLGFDVSPTAVQWARRRFPDLAGQLIVGDLLELPAALRARFDLVADVLTLQALAPELRERAAGALASLVSPRGVVLVVGHARDASVPLAGVDGPPWPLSCAELEELMLGAGLRPVRAPDVFDDEQAPPERWMRCAFVRC